MTSLNFVVSGAKSGIGLALTELALKTGHKVFAGVRQPLQAKALHALEQSKLSILELDINSDESCQRFAQNCAGVDVLINNAGVFLQDGDSTCGSTSSAVLLRTFDTNCVGSLRLTTALLPKLSDAAKIINITSKMGSIADNSSGSSTAYRVSKAALNMLTKNMALDFPKLTSICVHPGWVKTDMGGASAPLLVTESASGIFALLTNLQHRQSGQFFNYNGQSLPW